MNTLIVRSVLLCFLVSVASAQTCILTFNPFTGRLECGASASAGDVTQAGNNTFTGANDFSGATLLRLPNAATDPATCSVGQKYWNTTSFKFRICKAANTWDDEGRLAIQNNSVAVATEPILNFVAGTGIVVSTTNPTGKVTTTISADLAVLVDKTLANTYTAGAKQTFSSSSTTAGLNIVCGTLPTSPAANDVHCDSADGNQLKRWNGTAWDKVVTASVGNAKDRELDWPSGVCTSGGTSFGAHWSIPGTGGATIGDCTGWTDYATLSLQFSNAADNYATKTFRWPAGWDSAQAVSLVLSVWAGTGASGTAEFNARISCPTTPTVTYNSPATGSGTLSNDTLVAITINSIPVTGCTAGSLAVLKLGRNSAAAGTTHIAQMAQASLRFKVQ